MSLCSACLGHENVPVGDEQGSETACTRAKSGEDH